MIKQTEKLCNALEDKLSAEERRTQTRIADFELTDIVAPPVRARIRAYSDVSAADRYGKDIASFINDAYSNYHAVAWKADLCEIGSSSRWTLSAQCKPGDFFYVPRLKIIFDEQGKWVEKEGQIITCITHEPLALLEIGYALQIEALLNEEIIFRLQH